MRNTVSSTEQATAAKAWFTTSGHVEVSAQWSDSIGSVVLRGERDGHELVSMHLSADAARVLAEQLQQAVLR